MKDKRSKYIKKLKQYVKERLKKEGMKNLSKILKEIRQRYVKEIVKFGIKDPEQSWKPFKGKLLEDVILDYIVEELRKIGFEVIKGSKLEKADNKLGECLSKVKRSIVVDFGEFGMHLPDADLVVYEPKKCKPIAIISSKATLRERIAQTGYWNVKLKASPTTANIRVFFVTLDEDGDLTLKKPAKKGRAIAEVDTDGTFVITNKRLEESNKVKTIEKLLETFKKLTR
ncbi:MAG: BsaWI family type II restriction enzyme [candidate division WOR-3 bacterium]|jgi:type II restriction enzyme